ncbi:retrotransposon protein, putative, ty1-copia subclass [Tanacetum coccineum]
MIRVPAMKVFCEEGKVLVKGYDLEARTRYYEVSGQYSQVGKESFGIREVGFHYRLPKLRPLVGRKALDDDDGDMLMFISSLDSSKSHNVIGIAPVAIIDRQLPFEYTIASRSTDVMVVACLMLESITPELHRQFKNSLPNEMLQELKSMFEKQAGVKRFDPIQTFHACKQEEGKPVSPYVIKIKGYVEKLERISYVLPQYLSVDFILNGLTSDFVGFIRNYNMHNMGKTISELHALLIEYDKGLPKKAATPQVLAIQGHWKRNCPVYLTKLIKKKKQVGTASSSVICLDNCHYASTITRGVVLVSRLVDNSFIQCFTDYGILVSKNDVLYFNAIPRDGIYEIDMLNLVPNVNSIYTVSNKRVKHNLDSTYQWHCCLAHISKKHIEKRQHDGLLKSTDDESFDQCVSCLSGKMTRKPFLHRTKRVTDLFGLIHTDVCGLFRHVSKQGAGYFITFTDDYSRYGYVYLLKHKHDVFRTFKVFKNEVRNQLEKTIKALQSDRGGEYISQEFKDYLQACEIVQQLTPPYTPQHNGMSKRRNRTLLDMVRSLINPTTLSLSFWDYALESATRILNMVPTKKVDMTLYKLWYGKVPNLSYLKDTQRKQWVTISTSYQKTNFVLRGELEEIQDEDTSPSKNTSEIPAEVEGFKPPQEEEAQVHRSIRTHRAPKRLCLNVEVEEHSLGDLNEPTNYKAALLDLESDKWLDAMSAYMQSMKDNQDWCVVDLPPNGKSVRSKWIFKKNTDMDGKIHIYKAYLVTKGFTQTYGVHYKETFPPVVDIRAIRILIAIAVFYDYEIWQLDVKTAFLNGYLDEDINMVQLEGFVDPKHPKKACKLQRSIYGLKQASRSWIKRFDVEIKRFGFAKNLDEPCVYQKASGSDVTFLILYVDDIIIMGNHIPMLPSVKSYIGKCFAIKDLFKIDNSKHRNIPMQERLDLNKTQGASTPEELKRMKNDPYDSAVGSIMYAVRCTRPDVAFTNAKDMFLVYGENPKDELRVDYYCAVDWKSSKQSTTAMSAIEVEYIAASKAAMEAVCVSLNLLSRTRKFGHSTMELWSLIS